MLINPAVPAGGRSSEITKSCHLPPAWWEGSTATHSALLGLFSHNLPEYSKWHLPQASWYDDTPDQSFCNYLLWSFSVSALCKVGGDPEVSLL